MKKYGKYIVGYGTAFLISLIGLAWYMILPSHTALVILAMLAALPPLLLAVNMILAKQYVKKIKQTKVADMQGYMLRHRKEAEEASHTLLEKLQGLRHAMTAYAVLVWLLAACASLLGGMLYSYTSGLFFFFFVVYAGTIFCAVYTRFRRKEPIVLNDSAIVLQQDEYPLLYGTVCRAAETLNCHGKITILISFDCTASIVSDGSSYYLQLGTVLLNILSEEELYCICLHEFSHYSDKNQRAEREMQYGAWLSSDKGATRFITLVTNLFVFFDIRYLFDHMTYQFATSVVKETEADRDMAKHGNPVAAASALLKLKYDDQFRWESGVLDETPVYAAEKPNPHYIRDHIERFKHAIEARHKIWDAMIAQEILPNNASHPILKMRMETMGVERAECVEDKSSPAYREEMQKVLDYADKRLCDMQDTYERDRKEGYLEPLRRVTEWEERGMPVVAEDYADIISDLKQLGRHEAAEALCERAMQELDVNSSAHAYFIKGQALIRRYDETGVDLIYHAVENNHNYLEEGLMAIGEFYCMMGMEEKLLDYRQRAQQFAQKDVDEYSETGVLTKHDRLSREDMPEGMLEEILAYIRSIDGDIIQNIYLVRKTITDTFFTSAFIIHFYGGTDAQREEIMHKIFRYLDTYPVDWQFSLFDYFDYLDIKFDKIEGSLVYSKSKTQGGSV